MCFFQSRGGNVCCSLFQPQLAPVRNRPWCLNWRLWLTLDPISTLWTSWERAPSQVYDRHTNSRCKQVRSFIGKQYCVTALKYSHCCFSPIIYSSLYKHTHNYTHIHGHSNTHSDSSSCRHLWHLQPQEIDSISSALGGCGILIGFLWESGGLPFWLCF